MQFDAPTEYDLMQYMSNRIPLAIFVLYITAMFFVFLGTGILLLEAPLIGFSLLLGAADFIIITIINMRIMWLKAKNRELS